MTDQGNEPTRVDTPSVGGPHDPTVVGVPPVGPEPVTQTGGVEGPPTGGPPPWGPAGPPPDRRPWVIAGILGLIAIVAIALLLVGGDDDEDGTSETSTTVEETTTSESTTTSASTTTEAPTTTEAATTTEAPPVTADPAQCREAGSDPTDPESPAQAVFIAWTRGDEACADELMTDDALAELFARDGSGATDVFQGCTEQADPEPHTDCAFTYEGGATHYKLVFSPTDGWQVYDIEQVAD